MTANERIEQRSKRTAHFDRIADDARQELTRLEAAVAVRERAITQNPNGRDVVKIRNELVEFRFRVTEKRRIIANALFQSGRRF